MKAVALELPGLSATSDRIGVTKIANRYEMVRVRITMTGIERVKSAVPLWASSIGRKAARVVPVAAARGTASSRTAATAAALGGVPRSSRHWTFSAITIALSTSIPRARTRAAMEIWWSTPPPIANIASAEKVTSGTTEATTRPSRRPMARITIPATIRMPSSSDWLSCDRRAPTRSGWKATMVSSSGAIRRDASSSRARTASPKRTALTCSLATTATAIAISPSRRMRSPAGSRGPILTRATSPRGTAAPEGSRIEVAAISATDSISDCGRSRTVRSPSASDPPGRIWVRPESWAARAGAVTPSRRAAASSSSTVTCSPGSPTILTLATVGTSSSASRTSRAASSSTTGSADPVTATTTASWSVLSFALSTGSVTPAGNSSRAVARARRTSSHAVSVSLVVSSRSTLMTAVSA